MMRAPLASNFERGKVDEMSAASVFGKICGRPGLLVILAVATLALPAAAQRPTSPQANQIRAACRADYESICAGVPTGGSAALACLQKNAARTSPGCQEALRAVGGAPTPAAAPASPPPSAA